MSELESDLKVLIIRALNLEDITPEDIDTDMPLFNEGLGLDSIDALELGLAIKRTYDIVLDESNQSLREHFASVGRLAQFIAQNRK